MVGELVKRTGVVKLVAEAQGQFGNTGRGTSAVESHYWATTGEDTTD
jgi:hypothetical protein